MIVIGKRAHKRRVIESTKFAHRVRELERVVRHGMHIRIHGQDELVLGRIAGGGGARAGGDAAREEERGEEQRDRRGAAGAGPERARSIMTLPSRPRRRRRLPSPWVAHVAAARRRRRGVHFEFHCHYLGLGPLREIERDEGRGTRQGTVEGGRGGG